ncbi:hypothetical protein BH11PSE9_BH11PSE9_19230 [soil metagenome]
MERMVSTEPRSRFLYLSNLAPSFDFGTFKTILDVSRLRNPAVGISGALVFDGERFCQLLDGPGAAVQSLIDRLRADPRHVDITVLHAGSNAGNPILPGWANGYCGANDLDVFTGEAGLRGEAALAAFAAIVAQSDMSD